MSPQRKIDPLVQLLADIRQELGLTQQVMSELLGVPQSSISEWETGYVRPELSTIRRLLDALGYDVVAVKRH
jgi:transcriptional regulator with XRE-family HTH domain